LTEEARLPAHVEVSGLIRRAQAEGGFAAVLQKGHAEAGTIMVVLTENGTNARVFERMPQADGSRNWHCSQSQDADHKDEFETYLARRGRQDRDMWIVELDTAGGERLIGL
jgi:hypothetical protein